MRKNLPAFIIGGAPRCGTTWLYHLLDLHPSVYMAKPLSPEPKFFLVDELYERGLHYYSEKWFPDIVTGKVCGEKSTNYLESAMAATRINEQLPDVKLIFILRNPADRAYSNYLWSKMNGFEHEDFAKALEMEEKRDRELPEKLKYARPYSYFFRGRYADLLLPYFQLFGREQILCLRFEDIISEPEVLAVKLHRFVGIEERPGDVRQLGVVNQAGGKDEAGGVPAEIYKSLLERYREHNARLAGMIGEDFKLWEIS